MALRSLEQDWEEFASKVFEGFEPSEVQRVEMKRAFYAGTWNLLCTLKELGSPWVSAEQAADHLESIFFECMDFRNKLLNTQETNQ